jgi:hypothetical protein
MVAKNLKNKTIGLLSAFPVTATPGGLSDSLRGVFVVVAAIALVILVIQSWNSKRKRK